MKDYKFIDAIGDIDEDLIAQAMEYKPKKTVKLRFIALAACLAVLMAALAVFLILDRDDKEDALDVTDTTTSERENTEVPPEEGIVLYYEGGGSRDAIEEATNNTSTQIKVYLKPAVFLDFQIDMGKKIEKADTTPDTMTFTICGKEYEVKHKYASRLPLANSDKDYLKELSDIDLYSSDDIIILYRSSTNEILHFTRNDIYTSYKPTEILSESEIQEVAMRYLHELYGEAYMNNYDLDWCDFDSSKGQYSIKYSRNSFGILEGDYVWVSLYADGIIKRVLFKNKGVYDRIESEVSQEMIDKANKYMTELFTEADLQIVFEPELVINTIGDYYLCFYVSNGSNTLDRYYVSLNQFQ